MKNFLQYIVLAGIIGLVAYYLQLTHGHLILFTFTCLVCYLVGLWDMKVAYDKVLESKNIKLGAK